MQLARCARAFGSFILAPAFLFCTAGCPQATSSEAETGLADLFGLAPTPDEVAAPSDATESALTVPSSETPADTPPETPNGTPPDVPPSGPIARPPLPSPPANAAPPADSGLASRTSGVAPLAVFFDAMETDSPPWHPQVIQPGPGEDFASYHYAWDFGDPDSGTWATSGRSRNNAIGHIAAHVYEQPGTYNALLTITTPDGTQQFYYQTITVEAFSGATFYVSSSGGSDSNDGQSEAAPFGTLQRGMSALGPNTRLLLKRGDVWSVGGDLSAASQGPVTIAAYGEGARPVITTTGSDGLFGMGSDATDWRFVDLDIRKPGARVDGGEALRHPRTACLALRCRFEGFSGGVCHYDWNPSDAVGIVECEFTRQHNYGIYIAPNGTAPPCTRAFILGCSLGDNVAEHLIRLHTDKSLVGHNAFRQAPGAKHNLKLAATPQQLPSYPYRNWYSIVSDNYFTNPGSAWVVSAGPQDTLTRALVEKLVIERNYWDVPGKVAIESRGANQVTVRNNIFKDCREAISIGQGVPGFSSWSDWKIVNNTYSSSRVEGFFLNFGAQPENWTVLNNIVHLPGAVEESYVVWSNAGLKLAQLNCDNNLWNLPNRSAIVFIGSATYTMAQWQAQGKDPAGIAGDPALVDPSGGDFRLGAGSVAVDRGAASAIARDDYLGGLRPVGGGQDMGAFEH